MSRHLPLAILVAVLGLQLTVALAVHRSVALEPLPSVATSTASAAMARLRRTVEGQPPTANGTERAPGFELPLTDGGPVIASFWLDGRRAVRVEGRGATFGAALDAAAEALGKAPALAALDAGNRARGRLQLDLITTRAPMRMSPKLLRTFGLVGGLDGLGVILDDGSEALLGADELAAGGYLLAGRPLPFIDFQTGLALDRADRALARRASRPFADFEARPRRYFRFRGLSFVEAAPSGPTLPLVRGFPPGPPVTRDGLVRAALAGGHYLAAHVWENGRFAYDVDLVSGRSTNPADQNQPYSLPRHAGATYFLAQIWAATKDPELLSALERALQHLSDLVLDGGCEGQNARGERFVCVADRGATRSSLGSTALAVVAFAEYRLATGDKHFDELLHAMSVFLLDQQRPGGSFFHYYDLTSKRPDKVTQTLYFDGEAALALVRAHRIFGDERMLRAAEGALDALVGFYSRFYLGRFFIGEEHWTCIAAEAAWPALRHDRYREFCSDYAAFLRRGQFAPGETPSQPDLAGSYGITPFLVPANTPVGSRTEAMISAYQLTVHHGRPDEAIRGQILDAAAYLLRQQVREESRFWSPVAGAVGGMVASPTDRHVRIDFVQHACSALLRAADLVRQ